MPRVKVIELSTPLQAPATASASPAVLPSFSIRIGKSKYLLSSALTGTLCQPKLLANTIMPFSSSGKPGEPTPMAFTSSSL